MHSFNIRSRTNLLTPLALTLALLVVAPTRAAVISYETPAARDAWFAAAGPTTRTLDFEGPGGSGLYIRYLLSHGVTFTNAYGGPAARVLEAQGSLPPQYWALWLENATYPPNNGLNMSFTTPQHAIAFNRPIWDYMLEPPSSWLHMPLNVELTKAGTIVGSWTLNNDWGLNASTFTETFVGLTSESGFDRARIWFTVPPSTGALLRGRFSDLYFSTVPAPGALVMLAALGAIARRRRAA